MANTPKLVSMLSKGAFELSPCGFSLGKRVSAKMAGYPSLFLTLAKFPCKVPTSQLMRGKVRRNRRPKPRFAHGHVWTEQGGHTPLLLTPGVAGE